MQSDDGPTNTNIQRVSDLASQRSNWSRRVRNDIAQLLYKNLVAGSALKPAILNMRSEVLENSKRIAPREAGQYLQAGLEALSEIEHEVTNCTHVSQAQRLVALADGLVENGQTMYYIMNVRELFADMVQHIAKGGLEDIDIHWRISTFPLREASRIWDALCRSGAATQPISCESTAFTQWSTEQLEAFSDRRVRQELQVRIGSSGTLPEEPLIHDFLIWLMRMGTVIMRLEKLRRETPLHERVWTELAHDIKSKVPDRWKSHLEGVDHSDSPYAVVEHLLHKLKIHANRAASAMKEHLAKVINGDFYKAATYARQTLQMEKLAQFTNLKAWMTEEIPLQNVKLRMIDTRGIRRKSNQHQQR
jgi:hypothetical protein